MIDRIASSLRFRAKRLLRDAPLFRDAGNDEQWVRTIMNDSLRRTVLGLKPEGMATIEVSGRGWAAYPWAKYTSTGFPDFDIVDPPADFDEWASFDLAICEQVLEHVTDPLRALIHLRELVRPGGTVIVSTPFLIRIHGHPGDYWRFTPAGLELLMESAGLDSIVVQSWGNRQCVRANFRRWAPQRRWRSLQNEESFPLVVWATATRSS